MTWRALVGIETGGTKTMCVVADASSGAVRDRTRIATTDPGETLDAVNAWVSTTLGEGTIAGVGIAAFGPIDLDPASPDFTRLTQTPKLSWVGASLLEGLPVLAGVPVRAVTDVTGSALGERADGAGAGLDRLAYVTIGTGVGAGIILDGKPVVGTGFPELGHILVRRHAGDVFTGHCPYHGDCLEGMVAGPALRARFGLPAEEFTPDQQAEAAALVGDYAAQLAWILRIGFGVQRVIFGGGVMKIPGALETVRARVTEIAGGEIPFPDRAPFIVRPALEDDAGIRGTLELAREAAGGALAPAHA